SGKTLEGPSTPLVPTPVISIPQNEPNLETSTEKVQNPNVENTTHVPPPEEEESIFMEIPKTKAKKTVNVKIQDLNFPRPNSYPSKLPYPERMKVKENDKPSAQHSRFLKMFKQLRLEIRLKDAHVEMPKFNKWLNSLLRNKEKLEEIAITSVNAECSAIIMNKVPKKLEDPGKFLIPCVLQELDRTNTSALADSGASINLLPHSIYKQLGLEALKPTRMTLELANCSITHPMGIAEDVVVRVDGFTFLADFVVVNFEPNPRVPIILGRPFLRTAKALIDFFSLMKTSDSTFEEFIDEFTLPNSLPPGNNDSIHKKDIHEETFQTFSNPLFEFDDSFKSSNVNPLFEEKDKDVEITFSPSFILTSPEESDSIPPGINLNLSPTLEVSSSNPTSPTLTGEKVCSWKTPMFFSLIRFICRMMTRIAIRKKIICLLATFLHKKPKPLPQEVDDIKMKDDKVSSQIPLDTIVMPIRITFDNPIDFNDHFSKPKDFKKDLTVSFDSSKSSILPSPLFDSDSPFTAELSVSLTLNSLINEDKVFKPGILVYHAILDKNLVTLEENLKENISSGILLVFKDPSFLLPPPEPPAVYLDILYNDESFESGEGENIVVSNVEEDDSFTFTIRTFLPFLTYSEVSPLSCSTRSEDLIFDPDIITFHFLKPLAFLWKFLSSIFALPKDN
ncbi:reverse transcriptase domain-containing protein, partial [Tanacetum coccineum]